MQVAEPDSALRAHYEIHGSYLVVESGDRALARVARELLEPFACGARGSGGDELRIVLHAVGDRGAMPSSVETVARRREKLANESGAPYSLYRDDDRWIVDFGSFGSTALELRERRVSVWLVEPARLAPDTIAAFVRLAVVELLRLRGLYAVHAAVLAKGDRCVAIVGPSGRGKTTAAVALMRAGYSCLSDDSPLLRGSDRPEFVAFPSRVSVTDRTIAWFEELSAAAASFRSDSRKRSFEARTLFSELPPPAARPVALLFPQIVDRPASRLEVLPPARALAELLPETLLLLDDAVATAQFAVLSMLVRTTPSYRLHFGADVPNLPTIVDPLLAGNLPS